MLTIGNVGLQILIANSHPGRKEAKYRIWKMNKLNRYSTQSHSKPSSPSSSYTLYLQPAPHHYYLHSELAQVGMACLCTCKTSMHYFLLPQVVSRPLYVSE